MVVKTFGTITLARVDDGANGIPGKPGSDGKTPYVHTAYSWSADGQDRFMTVYPGENLLTNTSDFSSNWGAWPGQLSISKTTEYNGYPSLEFTPSISLNYALQNNVVKENSFKYTSSFWAKADNAGDKVHAELFGGIGATDFVLTTNWVHYSAVLTSTSNGTCYVGIPGGNKGNVYIALPKLEKGSVATPYTPSPLDDPEGTYPKFIGTYTDYVAEDSTDPAKYTWAKLRGEQGPKGEDGTDGLPGKDGVGIKSTQIMYAQSTSGTTAPTTGWTAQVPTLIKGQYLWTQTTWLYTDNTGESGYTVSYNAKDGNNGANGIAGKDGVGIKSTTITYASSTSGTTAPTGGFSATIPAVSAGSYLWTKTVWTYSDGTNETGYSVALMGKTGATGPKGATGATGPTGPQGPAGKDITSYSKGTTLPTTVAPANSQFWMVDAKGQCIAVYVSDGSKWVATPISASLIVAATFKGMNFEGVNFTGSNFKTTYTDVANTVGDSGVKFTGTGTLSGPELVFDSTTNESTPQSVRTAVAPEGFSAHVGAKAFGYFSAFGEMALGDANGNSGSLTAEKLQQMNNVGQVLWSGAFYMQGSHTITPSIPISQCFTGWNLWWSWFENGSVSNSQWVVQHIDKSFVATNSGQGTIVTLASSTGATISQKYVYPKDTTIQGYDSNANNPSKNWVLRMVVGA